MKTKIYLLGMPGSGKSTLGRPLANLLQLPFIDLDSEIEHSAKKTISEIFASEGEDVFRKIESSVLREYATSDRQFVMATGGGAPCFYDNISLLKDTGATIYLKISVDELYKRLETKTSHRPLLKEKEEGRLRTELEEKLRDRSRYYENADIILENDNISVEYLKRVLVEKPNT